MTYAATINVTTGIFKKTIEELNGHEEMTILLPNTVANRTLVAADRSADLVWSVGPVTLFEGTCTGAKHKRGMLECIVYNEAYEILQRFQPFNTSYTEEAASDILTALGAHVGIAVSWDGGADPDVSIRFDYANCMDVLIALAEVTGYDYWTTTGPLTIHIGDRGAAKGAITILENSTRILDRAKQRNNVRIRGVDADGNVIYGTANAGGATRYVTFTERKVSDQATLDALAEAKLVEINKDTGPSPLAVSLLVGNGLFPGDTVTLNEAWLQLQDDFRLWKVERHIDKVVIYPESPDRPIEKAIWDTRKYEDLGIYLVPVSQIPLGEQAFSTNLEFRPKAANPDTTVEWDDGAAGNATITFDSGASRTINKGDSGVLAAGDHWAYLVIETGNVTITTNWVNAVGPDKIFLAHLYVPTVVGGQTQHVLINPSYARGLKVGSHTLSDGVIITPDLRTAYNVSEGGGPAGIRISPTEIAGYSGGATKQFYMLTADGKAYFGGGAVVLESTGIIIDGAALFIVKDGAGAIVGGISGALGAFSIGNANGAQINITAIDGDTYIGSAGTGDTYIYSGADTYIDAGTGVIIIGTHMHPDFDSVVDLGAATPKYFRNAFVDSYYGTLLAVLHAGRHVTGGLDPLDVSAVGNHGHGTGNRQTFYAVTSKSTWYAHETNDPASALHAFGAITGDVSWTGAGSVSAGGGHGHNVTASPSPDVEEATEGEEMMVIVVDELLTDGRRYVKADLPEFDVFLEATYPIGATNERVMKDLKYRYHQLWEAQKQDKLPESEPRPLEWTGRKLRWDRDKEKADMEAKLAITKEEKLHNQRRANKDI